MALALESSGRKKLTKWGKKLTKAGGEKVRKSIIKLGKKGEPGYAVVAEKSVFTWKMGKKLK